MSAAPIHHAAISIASVSGRTGGIGAIEFAQPSLGHRLSRAAGIFVVGVVCGVLLLPVPLIHLFGIFFFVAMTGIAAKRVMTRRVLKGASGTCPACGGEGRFFVGFGGRGLKFPIATHCKHCQVELHLHPT